MSKKKDIDWDRQIKKISKYSNKLGYDIFIVKIPSGISNICFDSKVITIHSKLTKERQFYTILHELGHLSIHEKIDTKYKNLNYQYKKFSWKTMVYKLAEIEEEILAWNLGYKLAKKLNLKINRDSFESYKTSLVTSYLIYAVKPQIKKKFLKGFEQKNGKREI